MFILPGTINLDGLLFRKQKRLLRALGPNDEGIFDPKGEKDAEDNPKDEDEENGDTEDAATENPGETDFLNSDKKYPCDFDEGATQILDAS